MASVANTTTAPTCSTVRRTVIRRRSSVTAIDVFRADLEVGLYVIYRLARFENLRRSIAPGSASMIMNAIMPTAAFATD